MSDIGTRISSANRESAITVDLVEKARESREAFDSIYLELAQKVGKFIYSCVGDIDLSRDLTQDTFLRGYEVLMGLRGKGFTDEGESPDDESSFVKYLYRIAWNLIRSHLGKQKRIVLEEDATEVVSNGDSPDDAILQEELRVILYTKVGKLQDKYREVIMLRFTMDFSFKEVSDMLERRHQTVIQQNIRAIEYLQRNYHRLRKELPN